ncbi:MAG: hypothetical protein IPK82_26025 [Polyangiaceae bacterium]|nr:hypothetical protein [Polyangiaceae bacterium]
MRTFSFATLLTASFFALSACDGSSTGTGGSGGQGASGGQGGTGAQGGTGTTGGSTQGGTGGEGGTITPINECENGTAVCSADATCMDTPGYYECQCKPGYEGDGKTCTDIDECVTLVNDCDPNAVCTNTPGSFSCACPAGYEGDGKVCNARYTLVTSGPFHSCAIRQEGTIWCWGLNTSGQVGTGTSDAFFVRPVSIGDAKDWQLVTAGSAYTCALAQTGKVSCWGNNSFGQLGDGTIVAKTSPVPGATAFSDWTMIDAGTSHACGIRQGGIAMCWGRNNVGQIGDGTKDNNGDGTADNELSPVAVAGGGTYLTVSAGSDFSCGVRTDHTLWCWGLNSSRQLGDGTTTEAAAPVQEKSKATDWTTVDTGNAWACAVKQNGTRYCWGVNNFAQGGDGTQAAIVEPEQGDAVAEGKAVQLGWDAAACGIRDAGSVHCWGDGSLGQAAQSGAESIALSPTQVGTDADWKSISAGLRTVCGVRASGELLCWGTTSRGALASGFSADRSEPTLVGDAADWTSVETNVDNGCGLRAGKLYCWGRNLQSNLGDGTGTTRVSPVPIGDTLTFTSFSVGRFFGCGVAGTDLYCWGRDDLGQLANDVGITHSPSPALVVATANTSPWVQVSAGLDSACAVKQDKTLWCWGSDALGQVGDGAGTAGGATGQQVPKQVLPAAAADWNHVSITRDTACGLRGAGTLWCWGRNGDGQVGNGATANVVAPVQIGTAVYASVEAGQFHTCAIDTNGALWCWGRNSSGELGQGNTVNPINAPVQVGTDTDWAGVYLGMGAAHLRC